MVELRSRTVVSIGAALAVVAVGLTALAPGGVAPHGSVDRRTVDVPCSTLEAPSKSAGLANPTRDRWTFALEGARAAGSGSGLAAEGDYGPRVSFELVSETTLLVPEDAYAFLDDEHSRLTGTMVTASQTWNVTLRWVEAPANVYSPRAMAAVEMALEGVATRENGVQRPVELRVTFGGAPTPCHASASAFNWLHLCHEAPEDVPGEDPCVPAGWEVSASTTYYYNGPVAFAGTIGNGHLAGSGSGHGVAHNGAWGALP